MTDAIPLMDDPPVDVFRREADRALTGSYDTRLTRLETLFENIQRDLSRLDNSQHRMVAHLEQTATAMAAITQNLSGHTIAEEEQWRVVNQANKTLSEVAAALNDHLHQAGATSIRIDWIERLVFLLYGGLGTLATIVAGIYASKAL
jgi:predicted transcriptional regulator